MHLLLAESLWFEFRKFHEHEPQSVYHPVGLFHAHNPVVVIIALHFRFEHIVHQVQRINRLQQLILLLAVELPHVCLRSVEQHPLHESRRPQHLHLHYELPSSSVLASHVHYTVFLQRSVRHQLCGQILHFTYLLFRSLERQQCIQQAAYQVRMFAKHLLESQVRFRIQISHNRNSFNCSRNKFIIHKYLIQNYVKVSEIPILQTLKSPHTRAFLPPDMGESLLFHLH